MTIAYVRFQSSDHQYGDQEAIGILQDGSETFLFAWFSDELSFRTEEFTGKTVEQARDIKQERDVAYLQS